MLPKQLVTIREIDDLTDPYWSAASADGIQLHVEPNEVVLWSGRCQVTEVRPGSWKLQDHTLVVVTDQRTAFLTTAFDKGGGWAGFGIVGLAVATTANAVSKRRAAARSAGKVAIGHVRHEWLTGLGRRPVRALIGVTDVYVDLHLPSPAGPRTIELWGGGVGNEPFASWLAGVVARQRSSVAGTLSASQTETLQRYIEGGFDEGARPKDRAWFFPGDVEALIERRRPAVAASVSAEKQAQPGQRPVVGTCEHGTLSTDSDTLPEFDGQGALVMHPGETVLWTGQSGVATTAATAASGREQFQTMWTSADLGVVLTLTDRRLVYQVRPARPDAPSTVAGHLRHINVANVISTDGSDYGAGHRSTATVLDPPTTGIRVHLLFPARDVAFEEAWVRAVAAWRTANLPQLAQTAPQKWERLVTQRDSPTFSDGFWGPIAVLPLACFLGENAPRA